MPLHLPRLPSASDGPPLSAVLLESRRGPVEAVRPPERPSEEKAAPSRPAGDLYGVLDRRNGAAEAHLRRSLVLLLRMWYQAQKQPVMSTRGPTGFRNVAAAWRESPSAVVRCRPNAAAPPSLSAILLARRRWPITRQTRAKCPPVAGLVTGPTHVWTLPCDGPPRRMRPQNSMRPSYRRSPRARGRLRRAADACPALGMVSGRGLNLMLPVGGRGTFFQILRIPAHGA